MADNTEEIKVTADVSSLQSQLKSAENDLKNFNKQIAELQQIASTGAGAANRLGSTIAEIQGQASAAATKISGLKAEIASVGGAGAGFKTAAKEAEGLSVGTAGVTREIIVLGHEVISGNFSRIPGSLMVLTSRMGGLSLATVGAYAPLAAAAAIVGYLAYQALEAEKSLARLESAFELTGRTAQMSSGFVEQQLDALKKIDGVSDSAAQKILGIEAANTKLTAGMINGINQIVPLFEKAYGKDTPEHVKMLTDALGDLTEDGFKRLDDEMLNLSPTQFAVIANMIAVGDKSKAAQQILQDLGDRGGISIKSLQEVSRELTAELETMRQKFPDIEQYAEHATNSMGVHFAALKLQIEGVNAALAAQKSLEGQQQDKDDYQDAERMNKTLHEKDSLIAQIARDTEKMNAATKSGDTSTASVMSAGIKGDQDKLAQINKQANDKDFNAWATNERAKVDMFKAGSSERIAEAQEEVAKSAQIYGQGSQEYGQAVIRLDNERRASAQQASQAAVAAQKLEAADLIASARQTGSEIISDSHITEAQKLEQVRQTWSQIINGDKLTAAQRVEAERAAAGQVVQIRKQAASDADAIGKLDVATNSEIQKQNLEVEKAGLEQSVALMTMTEDQKVQKLKEFATTAANIDIQEQAQEQKKYAAGTLGYQQYADKILLIRSKLNTQLAQLDNQAAQHEVQSWRSTLAPIQGFFNQILTADRSNGQKMGQITLQALGTMVNGFVSARIKIETDWLSGQLAMALGADKYAEKSLLSWVASLLGISSAKDTAAATDAATDATAAVESEAIGKLNALGEITNAAAVAAANAFAATAAIPYVGPALAPGAATAAFGATMAWASALSFDVGAWNLPADMPANVHKGEMIVPANFADGVRSAISGGGNSGGGGLGGGGRGGPQITFAPQVQAMDGRSAVAYLSDPAVLRPLAARLSAYMDMNRSTRPSW